MAGGDPIRKWQRARGYHDSASMFPPRRQPFAPQDVYNSDLRFRIPFTGTKWRGSRPLAIFEAKVFTGCWDADGKVAGIKHSAKKAWKIASGIPTRSKPTRRKWGKMLCQLRLRVSGREEQPKFYVTSIMISGSGPPRDGSGKPREEQSYDTNGIDIWRYRT